MTTYCFGPFELDAASRRLSRDGKPVPLPERHLDVLIHLVTHAGAVQSKDALVSSAWRDVAVTDNSLEQAISALRRVFGSTDAVAIETVPRQGYRVRGEVATRAARASDRTLDELLAPHRAWIEGRAALETLERDGILRARAAFQQALQHMPEAASAHVGLANAAALQFEMTRTDDSPDVASLELAVHHAREACGLDPQSGEVWATLGFVLGRARRQSDALAALRRAVTLEPDNWRHHVRHAYGSWGEERLRAAHRALALLPGFPIAHWLAATVHVARRSLNEAERELAGGLAALHAEHAWRSRFSAVGLHWLHGLIAMSRGDREEARAAFERELALDTRGHLYARESCANAWYALGVLCLRETRLADARHALATAREHVPLHPMASLAAAAIAAQEGRSEARVPPSTGHSQSSSVDVSIVRAGELVLAGDVDGAAHVVDAALASAPPGTSDGWLLPVEPLLDVASNPATWNSPLGRLRARAA